MTPVYFRSLAKSFWSLPILHACWSTQRFWGRMSLGQNVNSPSARLVSFFSNTLYQYTSDSSRTVRPVSHKIPLGPFSVWFYLSRCVRTQSWPIYQHQYSCNSALRSLEVCVTAPTPAGWIAHTHTLAQLNQKVGLDWALHFCPHSIFSFSSVYKGWNESWQKLKSAKSELEMGWHYYLHKLFLLK